MKRFRFPLACLLVIAAAAFAQNEPPPTASPPPVDLVQVAPGEAAVLVPLPDDATAAEAKAVGEASAETLEDVAKGDVSIEQATRDQSKTLDMGGTDLFFWLSLIVGAVVRPKLIDPFVKRLTWLNDEAAGYVFVGLTAAFYTVAFYGLHDLSPLLPQTLGTWLIAAGVSVAGGQATASVGKSRAATVARSGSGATGAP